MTDYGSRIYESIISATQSEVILFFIALFVFLIISQIPFYRGKKSDKQHEREREKQVLDAYRENTAAITGLKVTLEIFGEKAQNSNERMIGSIVRVHSRIDEANTSTTAELGNLAKDVALVGAKVECLAAKQNEIAAKLGSGLIFQSGA